MTRRARAWTGITLLAVLIVNYAIVGIPLFRRRQYIQERSDAIIVSKNADDEYVLDIFRREKASLDKRIDMVNCIGLSLAVIIASWTGFGLISYKRDGAKGRGK